MGFTALCRGWVGKVIQVEYQLWLGVWGDDGSIDRDRRRGFIRKMVASVLTNHTSDICMMAILIGSSAERWDSEKWLWESLVDGEDMRFIRDRIQIKREASQRWNPEDQYHMRGWKRKQRGTLRREKSRRWAKKGEWKKNACNFTVQYCSQCHIWLSSTWTVAITNKGILCETQIRF